MPREQKQQDITTLFNQKKKITSKYFKGTLNENSVNDATDLSQTRTLKRKEADMTLLKEFDLNWEYGPCTGITRLERWERAERHNLNPPKDVKQLIQNHQEDEDYLQSLWKDYHL
ncbi:DNA polymerase delta subunit 4-like [Apostichopus japonicus]|uniref:DNA polymerase delta subunit 4-like n=1 Tax=Stichopus japonicus TaxID=307972 RepID=UPI003AB28211